MSESQAEKQAEGRPEQQGEGQAPSRVTTPGVARPPTTTTTAPPKPAQPALPAARPAPQRWGCLGCLGTALLWALLALIVLVPVLGGAAVLYVQRTLAQTSGTITVAGLSHPASVVRDRWGVPYISATTQHDVFFAQGYVTAQDRLFQMEVNRRIAAGRLSEIFGRGSGDSLLHTDEFLRTLNLYASAQAEYAGMDAQTQATLAAYADGVNAFLRQHQDNLPLEFTILGFVPQPWTPMDTVAYGRVVALSLDNIWQTKYTRALLLGHASQTTVDALFPPYPKSNPTLMTAGGEAAPLTPPTHVIGAIDQGQASMRAPITQAQRAAFARLPVEVLARLGDVHALLGSITDSLGSNDWVVDGTVTASGKPLLANDPHLGINEPAVWYQVGLRAPDLEVEGFSFPGVPGVIIGHTANIAWGVTNVGADNTDLYLEHLDETGHPGQYLFEGEWKPLVVRQETFAIRGEATPVTITVRSTQHGPLLNDVVKDLKELSTPVALQWTALQPGYSFAGFFQLDHATDWTTFRAAVANISISQNFVYADREGNIGYQMSGCLPIRSADNQLLPVSGELGDHEWQGCVPFAQMPSLFDPPTHIIVTANNQIVPGGYAAYVTSQWDPGYRARRITNLLAPASGLGVADIERVQNDVYSVPASQLVPLFVKVGQAAGGDAAAAAQILDSWDDQMTRESGAAALYEVALGTLARATFEPVVGKTLYSVYQGTTSAGNVMLALGDLLRTPQAPFFGATTDEQATRSRDGAIARALADAMGQMRALQGSDAGHWSWGALHQATFAHPLASVSPLNLVFGIAPVARPGDSATVDVGGDGGFSADPPNYAQHAIPSMREIIDLSNLDNSVWVIPAGESGQPYSPHYSDLLPLWDQGRYESMPFSPDAIGKAGRDFLTLQS